MNILDARKRGFETRFVMEADTDFRVRVRRDRILALWAAGLMGLDDAAAEGYAHTLVRAGIDRPDGNAVLERLCADLDGRVGQEAIRDRMMEAHAEARAKVGDA